MIDASGLCEIIIIEVIRVYVTVLYLDIFFDREDKMRYRYALYGSAFTITLLMYLLFGNVIVNVAVTFIAAVMIAMARKGKLTRKLFFALSVTGISVSIDFIVGYLFTEIPSADNLGFIASLASVVVYFLSFIIISQYVNLNKKDVFSKQLSGLVIVLITSIGTILIIIQDNSISRDMVLLVGASFLIIDFIIFYLYDAISNKYVIEQERNQIYEQMKAYESQIRMGIDNESKIRAIRHDMVNHIAGIYNYISDGQIDKAKGYIERLQKDLTDTRNYVNTGSIGIDSVMNYKISEALRAGVMVKTDISIPENMVMDEFDINIIMGNLMDNAIEAVSVIEEEAREPILVCIKYRSGFLIIKVDNICIESNLRYNKEGKMLSTKSDVSQHGYGLKNVRDAVIKNDGLMDVRVDNGWFQVMVNFPIG